MNRQTAAYRKGDWVWLGLMVALGFVLRLYRLGDQSLWLDEGFTWYRAMLPFDLGLQALRQVFTHPPLYHLLTHVWVRLGTSEWLLRLPSVLIGTATIPVLYRFGRQLEGRTLGLLAALMLTVNPFHIWYSRDARDYTLVTLLTLLVFASFWRLLRRERAWFQFILFSGMLYFSHYLGLLSALAQFIYLVFHLGRYRLLFRRWVGAQAIAFLPLSFWLIALFTQETQAIGIGWIPRPALWAPLITLWNFAATYTGVPGLLTIVTLLLFAIALTLGLWPKTRWRGLLLLWLLVPPVAMVIVSWGTGRNLYVDRYFIGGLPALLICVAWGAYRMLQKRPKVGASLAVLLVVASLANAARIYTAPELRKVDWRAAIGYVEDHAIPGDLVIMPSLESFAILAYYDGDLEWAHLTSYAGENNLASVAAGRERVWLILGYPQGSNHLLTNSRAFDTYDEGEPATVSWLATNRSAIADEQNFAGLTVLLVQLAP